MLFTHWVLTGPEKDVLREMVVSAVTLIFTAAWSVKVQRMKPKLKSLSCIF